MELVGDTNPLRRKVRTAFLEQREHRRVVLARDRCRVALQRGDTRRCRSVDHVGLAATPTRQLTHPRGCRARHVEHDLVAGDEPLREMTAQTTGALDRPAPIAELARPAQQLAIARQRRLDPQRCDRRVRRWIDRRGGVRALVRVDPDDHARAPFGSVMVGEAADGMPTSRPASGTSPLLSQTATGRRPGRQTLGEPTRRRQAIHEPTRPTTYRTLRTSTRTTGTSHTSRRFRGSRGLSGEGLDRRRLDPAEHGSGEPDPGGPVVAVEQLALREAKERLGDGVVEGVADCAHRTKPAGGSESLPGHPAAVVRSRGPSGRSRRWMVDVARWPYRSRRRRARRACDRRSTRRRLGGRAIDVGRGHF